MQLHSLTRSDLIFPNLPGNDARTLLRAFTERLEDGGVVKSANEVYEKLREREELGSTGIGNGVALPHCKLKGINQVVLAVATSAQGVDFGAVDGEPVRLFFMVLSPVKDPAAHLQSLAAISAGRTSSDGARGHSDLHCSCATTQEPRGRRTNLTASLQRPCPNACV